VSMQRSHYRFNSRQMLVKTAYVGGLGGQFTRAIGRDVTPRFEIVITQNSKYNLIYRRDILGSFKTRVGKLDQGGQGFLTRTQHQLRG